MENDLRTNYRLHSIYNWLVAIEFGELILSMSLQCLCLYLCLRHTTRIPIKYNQIQIYIHISVYIMFELNT